MFVSKRRYMRLDEEIISAEERNGQENTPNLLNDRQTFVLIYNSIFFLLCSFTLMMASALRKPSTKSNHIVTMTID